MIVRTSGPCEALWLERSQMITELDTYDWSEVFGEGSGGNCGPIIPDYPPGETISAETFGREDVVQILGMVEGENDGSSWIIYGRLRDGRYFFAKASCDYTGWDCQAGNQGAVANTREALVTFCMDDEDRERFGLQ